MILNSLRLTSLPWFNARPGQWRYALRNAIAMCLALAIAYALQLDEPYWAMTSAAVVSFPTQGGVISKSLGRIAGSILGAFAALFIAGHTLDDPWLFTWAMASWLAVCTLMASQFQYNVAYSFSLAGYTAAIIAFPLLNTVSTTELWDVAQSRVCEVIVGILCGGLMMMVLPGTADGTTLLNTLTNLHQRLLEHAKLLWRQETTDEIRTAHERMISQILTTNLLRVQAFWSHYRFRHQNPRINYLLHQYLRAISVTSGIRRLLINWPNAPAHLWPAIEQLLAQLGNPQADALHIARSLASLKPPEHADYHYRAFWFRLSHYCQLLQNCRRELLQLTLPEGRPVKAVPRTPALARHTDWLESVWAALRTFCVISVTSAWSIGSQWDEGGAALTLAAICCVLYATTPTALFSLTLLLRTLLLLSLFSFAVKFGLMVQITQLWQFLLFLFPLLLTMQLIKQQHPKFAGLWGQLIVFMGSFIAVTNPPVYDFADFLNQNLAKILGVGLAWVAFSVLRPGSDNLKSRRHIRALRRAFIDQLSRRPARTQSMFESLVYHLVSQLNSSKDEASRRWLLRWGVVLLNCSHVVWQLRSWGAPGDPLTQVRDVALHLVQGVMTERGVHHRSLDNALTTLKTLTTTLERHHREDARNLASHIWMLYCSLSQLQLAPVLPAIEQNTQC
ncbi:fusaric acid resistance protein [Mangrovibacter sp. MFB070]|uniref:FUSC family protein n=1 Tax=Mangrovibacter sp. MFB070 TaxID=1224318 RepID=UPI0004D3BA3D|nr:FUSC family protein [Mangrovibacter sp. MFB070]KEA52879.1 fusaric acid resistance protein [Mangrovibacter sp. MFB070]